MTGRRNSWASLLPGNAVHSPAQDGGPLERLARIECSSTGNIPVPAEDWVWLRQALADAVAGTPAAEAFGFGAGVGRSNRTPRGRLISAARRRAVTLLIPADAKNPNQATAAVHDVISGRIAPPTPEAAAALAELRRLRDDFPKSKPGIYVIVAEIFKN